CLMLANYGHTNTIIKNKLAFTIEFLDRYVPTLDSKLIPVLKIIRQKNDVVLNEYIFSQIIGKGSKKLSLQSLLLWGIKLDQFSDKFKSLLDLTLTLVDKNINTFAIQKVPLLYHAIHYSAINCAEL